METYTISIDSSQSSKNNSFSIRLAPTVVLTNIVQVEVLRASVSNPSNSLDAIYVYVDELADNRQNIRVAELKETGSTFDNAKLRGALVSWNTVSGISRQTFMKNSHWDHSLHFDKPKDSLPLLTISIYDQDGVILSETRSGHTFLTLRFHCKIHVPEPVKEALEAPKPPVPISKYKPETPNVITKYGLYIFLALVVLIGSRILFRGSPSSAPLGLD